MKKIILTLAVYLLAVFPVYGESVIRFVPFTALKSLDPLNGLGVTYIHSF